MRWKSEGGFVPAWGRGEDGKEKMNSDGKRWSTMRDGRTLASGGMWCRTFEKISGSAAREQAGS